jgi:Ala-tRNA(Pro) deacylase
MPLEKLRNFLNRHKIKYLMIRHSPAYTAQEIAASAHVSGNEMAKTVMVKVDGKMAMAVLPASHKVDFGLLKMVTGATDVELATEQEFANLFPGCELGAMPPFGNLFDMEVYAAESLAEDEEIFFNAGSHSELMKLAYRDFERLVEPRVVTLSALA